MSRVHVVKLGDLLYKLSQRYYGTPTKWKLIVSANPQLKGRGLAIDGSPLIYPLESLIIPEDTKKQKPTPVIQANSENECTIVIDGQQFAFFSEFSLTQDIDSFDSFTFTAPFNPEIAEYRSAFKPFSYKSCDVFYGNELQFSGILLAPQTQSGPTVNPISLTGYPKCGVLECHLPITKFPLEFNNQNLQQITNSLISDYGISAQFLSPAGNRFSKVSPEPTQSVIDFLIELANQRGLLLTNNSNGDLVFWKTQNGPITATFKEGETPFISCVPNFKPQQFYSHITGIRPAKSGRASEKYTVINNFLVNQGVSRNFNFTISDSDVSDIQAVTKAKAGRMFAEAMQYQLTVCAHKNRSGQLYKKNTRVSVLAPRAQIYHDTEFLIKSVHMSRSSNGGDITVLDLVLPEVYTGQLPTRFPFEE